MRWMRIMVLAVWLALGVRVDALGSSASIPLDDFDTEEIQQFLDNLESESVTGFSFADMLFDNKSLYI